MRKNASHLVRQKPHTTVYREFVFNVAVGANNRSLEQVIGFFFALLPTHAHAFSAASRVYRLFVHGLILSLAVTYR